MSLLLKASSNNRYLVDSNNSPVFLLGDAAWSLPVQLTRENTITYLDNRQSLGFNSYICEIVNANDGFASNAPADAYGNLPFTGTPFASPLNEPYWQQIDYKFQQSANRGFVIQATLAYFGFNGGSEGWWSQLVSAGAANVQAYAAAVAARYVNYDNIIWVNGGDYFPPDMTIPNALAAGVLSQDTRHLFTTHWGRGDAGTRGNPSWLTFNSIYTHLVDISSLVLSTYNATTQPLILIEDIYEGTWPGQPTLTTKEVRGEAWQGYLSGNCAVNYGDHGIWPFATNWQNSLNAPGALCMLVLANFFRSINWWKLVPDQSNTMVTSGRGTIGTTAYVCAGRATDGSLGVAYLPDATVAIGVNLASFSSTVSAWWVDPNNGARVSAGTFSPTGSHSFSRSTANSGGDADWTLLLNAAPGGVPAMFGFWGG